MEMPAGISRNEQIYLTGLQETLWIHFKRNDKELVWLFLF